jgi:hypothetical protein
VTEEVINATCPESIADALIYCGAEVVCFTDKVLSKHERSDYPGLVFVVDELRWWLFSGVAPAWVIGFENG